MWDSAALAEWASPPLKLTLVELLANIVFAADLIDELMTKEALAEPFAGFSEAVLAIHVNASGALEALGVEEVWSVVDERPRT